MGYNKFTQRGAVLYFLGINFVNFFTFNFILKLSLTFKRCLAFLYPVFQKAFILVLTSGGDIIGKITTSKSKIKDKVLTVL